LVPNNVATLTKAGLQVVVEAGAGEAAGYRDEAFAAKGAEIAGSRSDALSAEILLQIRAPGANPTHGTEDLETFRSGQIVVGMCDPLGASQAVQDVAATGASLFALELIPRITRAQSMDVLSSMATVAGYRAVLLAAVELPKMFPMLMTAAGTVKAARIFVIGAGVAGLQAIATAKRLGGVVHAYDVRPACREQVESLGGKFVELQLETGQSEDAGGYARELGEEFYDRQRELLGDVVKDSDVVVTTAAIPGKPSPRLITRGAVEAMAPGSVIVDLAAERGGNCELSQPDQRVGHQGVVILGPTNLPAEIPFHASQMYSNNITKFLLNLVKDGQVAMNMEDEIIRDTLVAHAGQVCHPRIRDLLGLEPLESQAGTGEAAAEGDEEAAAENEEAAAENQDNDGAATGEQDPSPESPSA
jgi:NAD(P) transhydrogenase subunit alpha